MVIKFNELPSKSISLILTGYNLTDQLSKAVFVQSQTVTVDLVFDPCVDIMILCKNGLLS